MRILSSHLAQSFALLAIVVCSTASAQVTAVRITTTSDQTKQAGIAKLLDAGYGLSVTCDNCGSTSSGPASSVTATEGPAHDGGYEWGVDLARVGGAAIAEGQAAMAASVPVVIASNQSNVGVSVNNTPTVSQGAAAASTAGWPATAGTVAAATAAWTSATTVDIAAQLTVTGYSVVALSFNPSGSITAGSLNFEVSDDSGTTWYAATATRQDSATSETTFALNTATKKLWQIGVGGLTTVRVRLNPVITGAGTANIRLQASNAAPETQVTVAQAAAASLNATVTGTVTTTPPSNASTNIAQIAGSTASTATTGVLLTGIEGRAGTSLESTAGVLDLNIKNVGNSAASTAATGVLKVGVTGNAGAAFDSATAAAAPANAVQVGLRESTNLVGAVQCDKSFNTSVTSAATTSLVAVSSTAAIYLCSYVIEIIGVATTAGSAQLEFGTGSACATTQQVITPAYLGTLDGTNKSATVIAQGPGTGYLAKSGASGVLCLVAGADANSIKVFGTYAQF